MKHKENKLTEEERKKAWDVAYECLHWGDENVRVIEVDQRQLIVLIHNLTKQKK